MNKNEQKWFYTKVKRAIGQFDMIQTDDHVAVALSGGKDSLVLLYLLHQLQQHSHLKFQLSAVHVDCGWPGQDFYSLKTLCSNLSIPLSFEKSCIAQAIFPDGNLIANPCSLCSRLRRGALLQWAERNQCNKLALGHHRDDFVETWFLNLLHGGQYQVFAPRITYEDRQIAIIRPLVYLDEQTCTQLAQRFQLQPCANRCPVNHQTQRQAVKDLLHTMRLQYPDLNQKVLHALEHTQPEQLWSVYLKNAVQD